MEMAKEDWKIYEEGKKMLEKQKENKEESMKANKTKHLIYELDQIAFGNRERNNKRLHDMHQLVDEEISELERIATEYESNKHYIELGKAVEYAVQNEIRFIRQMTNGEKLAFIDKYDKAKLLKIFNEMVEENKNMKACIYRAQAQGGEFNE